MFGDQDPEGSPLENQRVLPDSYPLSFHQRCSSVPFRHFKAVGGLNSCFLDIRLRSAISSLSPDRDVCRPNDSPMKTQEAV